MNQILKSEFWFSYSRLEWAIVPHFKKHFESLIVIQMTVDLSANVLLWCAVCCSWCLFLVLRWVSWSHLCDRFNWWRAAVRIKGGLWWVKTLWVSHLNLKTKHFWCHHFSTDYSFSCPKLEAFKRWKRWWRIKAFESWVLCHNGNV